MTQDFNLRDKVNISGQPDEDGDVALTAYSCTVYMTRKEMRQMRDHLTQLLADTEPGVRPEIFPGIEVKVIQTSHKDLLGTIGLVQRTTPSGNYEVMIGNESVILGPQQVERAKW